MNEIAILDPGPRVPRRDAPVTPKPDKIKATYRGATMAVAPNIFELLQEMYAEVGLLTMSEAKVLKQIDSVLKTGACFLAMIDDEVVGSVGIEPSVMWWSEDVVLSERWTFVKKDYRRSTIAKDLLKLIDDFSVKMDMTLVIGVFSPSQTVAKNRLFRRFFQPIGEIFIGGNRDVLR